MAKIVHLKWTELQREIATKAHKGKTLDELVEAGFTKSLVSKVLNAIKSGQKLPENREPRTENQERKNPAAQPTSRAGVPTAPIAVGKITITPENWGLTQYGSLLILDTYNKTKRDINYGGTMGDFLCDMCEFYRRILNYKEVEYAAGTSEGTGGSEQDGRAGPEPVPQLTETK